MKSELPTANNIGLLIIRLLIDIFFPSCEMWRNILVGITNGELIIGNKLNNEINIDN